MTREYPIWWFENTLSFPSDETSLGSGLPSHLPMGDVPYPSSPSHGFLHHIIGTLNSAIRIHAITHLGILSSKFLLWNFRYVCYYNNPLAWIIHELRWIRV